MRVNCEKQVWEVHYAGALCNSPTDSKFTLSENIKALVEEPELDYYRIVGEVETIL